MADSVQDTPSLRNEWCLVDKSYGYYDIFGFSGDIKLSVLAASAEIVFLNHEIREKHERK
jgi:hypothetical protein